MTEGQALPLDSCLPVSCRPLYLALEISGAWDVAFNLTVSVPRDTFTTRIFSFGVLLVKQGDERTGWLCFSDNPHPQPNRQWKEQSVDECRGKFS